MKDLLTLYRQRAEKQTEFNYGIMTADRYVRSLQDDIGVDGCYKLAASKSMSWNDVLEKSKKTLVYSNPDMVLCGKRPAQRMVPGSGQVWTREASDPYASSIELPKNTLMAFRHVLTTPRKDRDGDVLRTEGAIPDPKMLLLWQHVHTLPIGKMIQVVEHNEKRLSMISAIVDMNELCHDAAVMVDNDMARLLS